MGSLSRFPHVSANLPCDIIIDIFTRLPVKSLCRFKSVSKSVCALVRSQVFIKKHLSRSILESDPKLILKNEFKLYGVEKMDEEGEVEDVRNSSMIIRSKYKARKLQVPFGLSLEKVEVSGSCNGLLCISDQRCNEDIYLFNPSTREYRKLPMPEFDVPTIETTCFTSLGFGYHQASDDYKVMRSVYLYDKPFVDIESYECEARVYSLASDTWKKIGTGDIPFHISSRAALWFNEFMIWKASRGGLGRGMTVHVVAFDMNNEVFMEIQRPDPLVLSSSDSDKFQFDVGVFRGEFSIFQVWKSNRVEIWTVKEFPRKESWSRVFVIGTDFIQDHLFVYLKPVCEMQRMNKKKILLMETREGSLVLYDFENQISQDIKIKGAPRWFVAKTVVESLVSPSPLVVGEDDDAN